MSLRALRREGHLPTLLACLGHFEVSFGVWVLLGALGPFIAKDLGIPPSKRGIVVAVPLLSAAVFRILIGWLADRFGPRRIGTISMTAVILPLVFAWVAGASFAGILLVGVGLGIAGASFAVALPLASSHYPAPLQGLALGIAGAGNSGTILTALLAPRIAQHIGWRATMGIAAIPVGIAAIAFRVLAREAPSSSRTPLRFGAVLAPLRERDCRRICAMYALTFGGFVGFTSYLPTFLVGRFGISKVAAGTFAAAAAGAGSVMRPVGGYLADRFGGTRVLRVVFASAAAIAIGLASGPRLTPTAALFVALLGTLGVGNGAVFQLVPLRFAGRVGAITGVVGAAGGLGGFFIPTAMGALHGPSRSLFFAAFGLAAVSATLSLGSIRTSWLRHREESALSEAAV